MGIVKFLLYSLLVIMSHNVVADNYGKASDYGKSLLGNLKSVSTKVSSDSVPGFKNTDNYGFDNGDVLDRQAPLAAQDKYGSFVTKQFNRENKIILSDRDELLVSADKLTRDPVKSMAKYFKSKVQQIKSKAAEIIKCEQSGEPYLVSCKYLLKPVPYYGEKDCEEQGERAIEVCKKELAVKPIYDIKTCEQQGNPIVRIAIATLQEKTHEKVRVPVVERIYKASVKYRDNRHTPYHYRGKPHWTRDYYIETKRVQDGMRWDRKRTNFFSFGKIQVPNYKNVQIWNWENRTISYEMKHPSVSIVHAEYRESPVIQRVKVLSGKWNRDSVYESKLIRWDRVLTKSRTANIPDSIFHWVGGTVSVSGASCVKTGERCVDSNDRILYGVKVKKSCWRKSITYNCKFPSQDNCKTLRQQGCSQIEGKCLKKFDNICVNYQHTMQCFNHFEDQWTGCESFKSRSSCDLVRNICSKGKETKIIAGRDVKRDCWQRTLSHACSYPSLNNCEQFRLPSCKQVRQKCLKTVNNTCVVVARTYRCVDGVNDSYESNCSDLERKALEGVCERVTHEKSIKSTKAVDGFDYDAIWEHTNIFRCQYKSKNNCTILRARGCIEKSKQCKKMVSNTCVVWNKTYECKLHVQTSSSVSGEIPKCLDGNCKGEDDVNDGNIGDAVAQLSVLQEISKDVKGDSLTSPSIFKGDVRNCKTNPLDFKNCCRLSGWGKVIGLAKCSVEEKQLANLRSKKYCVPIGKYCAKWAPLKAWCMQKRRSYCCFKGKLQRILQVEAHKQLGISWGSAKDPNCQGLAPKDLQRVDFSKLNLSEVYGDVLSTYKTHDVSKVQQSLKSQLTGAVQKGGYEKEPPKIQ